MLQHAEFQNSKRIYNTTLLSGCTCFALEMSLELFNLAIGHQHEETIYFLDTQKIQLCVECLK